MSFRCLQRYSPAVFALLACGVAAFSSARAQSTDADGDGVPNHIESPDMFYSAGEAGTIVAITSDLTSPDSFATLFDGSTTAVFNFNSAQAFAGATIFRIEYAMPVELTSVTVVSSNNLGPGGTAKLQGSNDGTTWTELSTANVSLSTSADKVFPVQQNAGAYKFYRILGVATASSNTNTILEITSVVSPSFPSLNPKPAGGTINDFDGDGTANHLDTDSDADGATDAQESGTNGSAYVAYALNADIKTTADFDKDGTADALDQDSDGDGISNWLEGYQPLGSERAMAFYKSRLIVSSFHTAFFRAKDGGYYVSGEASTPTGSSQTTPLKVSPKNGYNFTGEIIDVAVVGLSNQLFLLSTDGLWAWGVENEGIDTNLTTSASFQKVTLPSAINPANVAFITGSGSNGALALVMKDGTVWTSVSSNADASLHGAGLAVRSSTFVQVMLDAHTPLTGISDLEYTSQGAIAYSAQRHKFYTWGPDTYLGDGNASAKRAFATEMVNPLPPGVGVVQVGGTATSSGPTYFVFGTDGRVYSMGQNDLGAAGQGSTTVITSWGLVKNEAGTAPLEGVAFLSAQQGFLGQAGASVLLENGRLLSWGSDDAGMRAIGGSRSLPTEPNGVVRGREIFTVESGGHFTTVLFASCAGEIANTGHNPNGAFGDGTTADRTQYETAMFLGELAARCDPDTDGDGVANYLELDSDNDGCADAAEAAPGALFYDTFALSACVDTCTDTDGDGLADLQDIDADNDGIPNAVESPADYYTLQEALDSLKITSDLVTLDDTQADNDIQILHDGSTTATFDFTAGQSLSNRELFRLFYIVPLPLSNVTIVNNSSLGTGVTATLQGSNDGATWTDLSNTPVSLATTSSKVLPVEKNAASYRFYRILTGTNAATSSSSVTLGEVTGTLAASYVHNPSLFAKGNCTDSDGDGASDYLDTDSDGDGCFDAVEGGAVTTASRSSYDSATGVFSSTGTNGLSDAVEAPADSGAINYPSAYDFFALSADRESCIDSDGDGLPDYADADADNDGVLNVTEAPSCFFSAAEWNTANKSSQVLISSDLATSTNFTNFSALANGVGGTNGAVQFATNQSALNKSYLTFQFINPVRLDALYLSRTSSTQINGSGLILQGANSLTNWVNLMPAATNVANASVTTTNGAVVITNGNRYAVSTNAAAYRYYRLYSTNTNAPAAGVLSEVYFDVNTNSYITSLFAKTNCATDTDTDGVVNYLDLDSDGDGSGDAYESGASTNRATNYAFPTNSVNINGVPTAVQTNANSDTVTYNSTYSAYATNSSEALTTDTDQDGIPDLVDLDDDNDGILDLEESGPIGLPTYTSFPNGGTNGTGQLSNGCDTTSFTVTTTGGVTINNTASTTAIGSCVFNNNNYVPALPSANTIGFNMAGASNALSGTITITFSKPVTDPLIYFSNNDYKYWDFAPTVGLVAVERLSGNSNFEVRGTRLGRLDPVHTSTSNSYLDCTAQPGGLNAPAYGVARIKGTFTTLQVNVVGVNASMDTTVMTLATQRLGCDTDGDGVANSLDSDSDGDGCPDSFEAGSTTNPAQSVIPGPYGLNGLSDGLETSTESGAINYASSYDFFVLSADRAPCDDTDGDGVPDVRDADADNDGVLNVTEASTCFFSANDWNTANKSSMVLVSSDLAVNPSMADFRRLTDGSGATNGAVQFATSQNSSNKAVLSFTFYNPVRLDALVLGKTNATEIFATNLILQGANSLTNWVNLMPVGTNVVNASTVTMSNGAVIVTNANRYAVSTNAAAYRYYRLFSTNTNAPSAGVLSEIYFDVNNDSYITSLFAKTNCATDTDTDGVVNYLDLDSDGDGSGDAYESGATTNRATNFAFPTNSVNINGVPTAVQTNANSDTVNYPSTYGLYATDPDENLTLDSDGDGIINIRDFDDDNDGVPDAVESPECFATAAEAVRPVRITSRLTSPDDNQSDGDIQMLRDGDTATLTFNFDAGQQLLGAEIFRLQYPTGVRLANITLVGTTSLGTGARAKLQGSRDGLTWNDLTSADVALDSAANKVFTVARNADRYLYYRILGTALATTTTNTIAEATSLGEWDSWTQLAGGTEPVSPLVPFNTLGLPLTGALFSGYTATNPTATFTFPTPVTDPVFGFYGVDFFNRRLTNQNGAPVVIEPVSVNAQTQISGNEIRDIDPTTASDTASAAGFVRLRGALTSLTISASPIHPQFPTNFNADGSQLVLFTQAPFIPSEHPLSSCVPRDDDGDGMPNALDPDSDDDGCSDSFEAGATTDPALSVIAGPYGANGLADGTETVAGSGIVRYSSTYPLMALDDVRSECIDTDGDGYPDYRDADADNDGALNVTEAPSCFFTANEWNTANKSSMVLVSSDLFTASGLNNFTALANGLGGTNGAVQFATNQTALNKSYLTFQFLNPVRLDALVLAKTNTNQITATNLILQGANSLTNWINLMPVGTNVANATSVTMSNGAVVVTNANRFAVSTNAAAYRYYRLFSTNTNAPSGGTLSEVYFDVNTNTYVTSLFAKTDCATDTDSDGTVNYLDLDSDGDGSGDAYESGASTNRATNYAFPTNSVNINGVPTAVQTNANSDTVTYNSTYTNYATDPTENLTRDTDNDGIVDVFDLDDDNDGVPDAMETDPCTDLSYTPAFANWKLDQGLVGFETQLEDPINPTFASTYPFWNGVFTVNGAPATATWDYAPPNGSNPGRGNYIVQNDLFFALATTPPSGAATVIRITLNNMVPGKLHRLRFDIHSNDVSLRTRVDGVATSFVTFNTGGVWQKRTLDFVPQTTTAVFELQVTTPPSGTSQGDMGLDNFEIGRPCVPDYDTDGDGVPNRIDPDSDNDGCSDAFESGATASPTATNIAGPYGSNGLADGVETTAGSGTINYTSTYTNLALVTGLAFCEDTDGDGVTDIRDVDDDNDGITDCEEGFSSAIDFTGVATGITNRAVEPTGYVLFNGTHLKSGNEASGGNAVGDAFGNLGISTKAGSNNQTTYQLTFTEPVDLNVRNQLGPTSGGFVTLDEFQIFTADGAGITLRDPANELEILSGTNWVSVPANFTANTIRWRLRAGTTSLAVGAGSFSFTASQASSFSWTQVNTSTTADNGVTLNFSTACADQDTDGDGIPNRLETDSDFDNCPDAFEAGTSTNSFTNTVAGPYGADGWADSIQTNAVPALTNITYTITTNNIALASAGGTTASTNVGSMSGNIMAGTNVAGRWFLSNFRYTKKAISTTNSITGATFTNDGAGTANPYDWGGVGVAMQVGAETTGIMAFSYQLRVAMNPGYRAENIYLLGKNPTSTFFYGPGGAITPPGGTIRVNGFTGTNTGTLFDPNDNLEATNGLTFSAGTNLQGYKGNEKTDLETTWYASVPASQPVQLSIDYAGQPRSSANEAFAFSVKVVADTYSTRATEDTVSNCSFPTASITSVTVNEGSPYAMVSVSLSSAAGAPVTFTPSLANGTGYAGADTGTAIEYYNGTSWVSAASGVTIPAGETSVLLRVAITPDPYYEISETVSISTGPLSGPVIPGSGATGTITIADDGTGNLFSAANTTGTPNAPGSPGVPAQLDNDASALTADADTDTVADRTDLDDDNDGITDCEEGFSGGLDFTGAATGFTNRAVDPTGYVLFSATQLKTGNEFADPIGDAFGNLGMSTKRGINNQTTYRLTFTKPVDLAVRNQLGPGFAGFVTGDEYEIFSANGAGIALRDPANELEIWNGTAWVSVPANYTANTIQWRLRGATGAVPVGEGSFTFTAIQASSLSWTQVNVSSTSDNGVTLNFSAQCVDEDTDGDNIPNRLDTDSDGDGCSDVYESGLASEPWPATLPEPYGTNGWADSVETNTVPALTNISYTITNNAITNATAGTNSLTTTNPFGGSMSGNIMAGTNVAGRWFVSNLRYTRKLAGPTNIITGSTFAATNNTNNPYGFAGVGLEVDTSRVETNGLTKLSYQVRVAMNPGYRAESIYLLGRNPNSTVFYGPVSGTNVYTNGGGAFRVNGFTGTGTGTVFDPNDNLVATNGQTFSSGDNLFGYKGLEKAPADTTWYLAVPATQPVTHSLDFTVQSFSSASEASAFAVKVVADPYTTAALDENVGGNCPPEVLPLAITIDSITPDNVLNAAESGGTVNITGTTTGAQPGDTVTLTVNGQPYTGTVAEDGTYSIPVSGADLAADTSIDASITSGGNTAAAEKPYTADTTPPAAPTVVPQATTDTTPTVTGMVTLGAGETLAVTINGTTYTTANGLTVDPNAGTWSVTLPNTPEGTYPVTATVTDAAGNSTSDATTNELSIDTTPPAAPTVVPQITNDATPTVTGTVTLGPGETLAVTINGTTYTTANGLTVDPNAGTWSVTLPTTPAGTYAVTATVTDAAGNSTSDTTTDELIIDTVPPTPGITVNNVTADNILNAAESGQSINITGTTTGAKPDDTVTLTINGQEFTGQVAADGTYSIAVPGSDLAADPDATIGASVSTTDTAGNVGTGTADKPYTVDTTAPTPGITVNNVTADNILNAAESGQSINITGTTTGTRAGDTVTLTINGKTFTGTVDANGNYSIAVPGADLAADSDKTIAASVAATDAAGNTATATATKTYDVDTEAPKPTITINDVTADNVLNAAESGGNVTISGTTTGTKKGDTVTLTVNGVEYTGKVDASGNYSISVPGSDLAADPDATISASVSTTDVAGNIGTGNDTQPYTVDTTAPALTVTSVGEDTGASSTDKITKDNTLTLTGTTEPGAKVDIYDNGNLIGTVTAGPDGTYTFTTPPLADGEYDFTVTATDAAGNTTDPVSAGTWKVDTAVEITITNIAGDTVDPNDPTGVYDTTERGEDAATVATPVTISGTTDAEPGSTVVMTINGKNYTALVQAGGTWSITLSNEDSLAFNHGSTYPITASVQDLAGNTDSTTGGLFALVVDIALPDVPTVNNLKTTDTTPVVSGTAKKIDPNDPTAYLPLEPDDTITITLNGVTVTATITESGTNLPGVGYDAATGKWTLDTGGVAGTDFNLADGTYDIAITSTSEGFTETDISTGELIIRTTPPAITIDPIAADDLINALEKNQSLTISGTTDAEPGSTVNLTGPDGINYTATVLAGLNGAPNYYTVTVPAAVVATFTDGDKTLNASVTNEFGLTGTAARPYEVDATPPAAPVITLAEDNVGSITDDVLDNGLTDDKLPLLVITAEPGTTVKVYSGGQLVGTATEDPEKPGTYTLQLTAPLADGPHSFVAVATDDAGNNSPSSAPFDLTVDTTPPTPTIALDDVTDDNILNAAESGQSINITGTTTGAKQGDTVTLTINDKPFTGTVDASGNFSIAVPGSDLAADADKTIAASVSSADAAGNTGTATSTQPYDVDTTPPAVPTVVPQTTNDTTPVITGTADVEPGETLNVTVNGATYTVVPDANGNWSLDTGTATPVSGTLGTFVDGQSYPVTATVTDAAGNSATDVTTNELTIDLTPPAAPTVVSQVTNDKTPTVTGTVMLGAGETLEVTINGTTYTTSNGLTVDSAAGTWAVTLPETIDGTYPVTATVTDAAGNSTSDATTNELTIDTVPPTPGITLNDVTEDNILNAAESGQLINITGTTTGTKEGDTVTLTINGKPFTGQVDAEGKFSIAVPGSDLAADTTVAASVSTTDAAGNTGSGTDTHDYTVDVTPPAAPTVVSQVTNDSTPTVTGTVTLGEGETLAVTINGTTYTTANGLTVSGSNWSVTLPTTPDGMYPVTATVTDAAGNSTSDTTSDELTIDTTPPPVPYVVSQTTNDTTPVITGTAVVEPGDTLTVTVNGATYTVVPDAGGNWSLDTETATPTGGTLGAFVDGQSYPVTATVTDPSGNASTDTTTDELTIDTTPPAPTITIDDVTADNIVNAAEAVGNIIITGTTEGTKEGDLVTLTINGKTFTGTVAADLSYSISVPAADLAADTTVAASVSTTDEAGNTGTANATHLYEVDTVAPTPTIAVNNVTPDNILNETEQGEMIAITGTTTGTKEGDTVTLTINGKTFTGKVAADLSYSINVPGADLAADPDKTINASISTIDEAGNTGTANATKKYAVAGDLAVNSPSVNEASPFVLFTVTGNPGQEVSLALAAGTATTDDFGPAFQYFDGTDWVDYTAGDLVPLDASGELLVRVAIVNDETPEGAHDFTLTATSDGTAPATGTASILDNGSGSLFGPDNTAGTPDQPGENGLSTDLVRDDDRPLTVGSIEVNEGSSFGVFTVKSALTDPTTAAGQMVSLALAAGTATTADFGALQYFDGFSWQPYTAGDLVPLNANGELLVRVAIVNDETPEGAHDFTLTATNTGGTPVFGTATILDNGSGSIFLADNTTGTPDDPTAPGYSGPVRDDDRLLAVNSVTVNENSPFAVFTVTGAANQLAGLALSTGSAGAGDFGPGIQWFDGVSWTNYEPGSFVPLDSNGKLLVRTTITTDNIFETSETFNLTVANTGGATVSGTGTITDNGTGNLYGPNNTSGTPDAPGTNGLPANLILDDDRRPFPVLDWLQPLPNLPTNFSHSQILGNDLGANLRLVTTPVAIRTAQGGTVMITSRTVTYTPPAGGLPANVVDSFDYTVENAFGRSTGSVNLMSKERASAIPIRIISATDHSSGGKLVKICALPMTTYEVYATSDLDNGGPVIPEENPAWEKVGSYTANGRGDIEFVDANAGSQRFYRLRIR